MKKISIAFAAALALASFAGCKKKGGAGEAMAKMSEFKDKMCKCSDKACADKVTDEMTKWSQEMAKTADKEAKVSEEDTKKMQEVTEEFTKCATKAMTGGGDKKDEPKKDDSAGAAPAGGGGMPQECEDYKAAMEKLASCDKIPKEAKDAMKQGFEQMSSSWKDMGTMPKEARDAAATACKGAADAAKQAMAACN